MRIDIKHLQGVGQSASAEPRITKPTPLFSGSGIVNSGLVHALFSSCRHQGSSAQRPLNQASSAINALEGHPWLPLRGTAKKHADEQGGKVTLYSTCRVDEDKDQGGPCTRTE
jgi:hypothetical protein